MSNRILVFLISLAIICVALPENKLMAKGCNRPPVFNYVEEIERYVNCVKGLSQRYGKRAQQPRNPFLRHFLPTYNTDDDIQTGQNLQDFYDSEDN